MMGMQAEEEEAAAEADGATDINISASTDVIAGSARAVTSF